MALEFTNVYDKGVLYIMPDKQFNYFETTYFDHFNEKYNNLIDRYGTFRLEINHLKYLQIQLEEDFNRLEITNEFLKFIKKCISTNTVLKVYGD